MARFARSLWGPSLVAGVWGVGAYAGGMAGPVTTRERVVDLGALVGDVGVFVGNVGRMLGRVAVDARVPVGAKLVAAGMAAYAVSPLDLVPEALAPVGVLDDLWLLSRSVRHLVRSAGYDIVREHWDGDEESFGVLLVVAGVDR